MQHAGKYNHIIHNYSSSYVCCGTTVENIATSWKSNKSHPLELPRNVNFELKKLLTYLL